MTRRRVKVAPGRVNAVSPIGRLFPAAAFRNVVHVADHAVDISPAALRHCGAQIAGQRENVGGQLVAEPMLGDRGNDPRVVLGRGDYRPSWLAVAVAAACLGLFRCARTDRANRAPLHSLEGGFVLPANALAVVVV